jgi:putative hydrolase of the HAD superfamily
MTDIKAVLFDLDDTLLDDAKATLAYRRQFYDNHRARIPFPFETFYRIWEEQVVSDLAGLARGESSLSGSRRNRMRIVFGNPDMTDVEADDYVGEYLHLYESSWELFADALTLLAQLQDAYLLGVVTNGDRHQQHQKILRFKLHRYLDAIVSCEDAGAPKPEIAIFNFAASRLELRNSECLFVGDGYERDVLGSRDAGMTPVWLKRSGAVPDKSAEGVLTIRSLAEVPGLLGG